MNVAIDTHRSVTGFFFLVTCCCAFSLVSCETGALPPPRDVSLVFSSNFCVNLTWSPAENLNSGMCSVKYLITEKTAQDSTPLAVVSTHHEKCLDVENGVSYAVRTLPMRCGNWTDSEEVVVRIPRRTEKLVKDFKCFYYSSGAMNCTWHPTDETKDLQLYYWYRGMPTALERCSLYLYSGEGETGCHLNGDFLSFSDLASEIFFLFNGTRGSSTLKNTFQMVPRDHMKPFPPKLRITVDGNMLRLYCSPTGGFKSNCWDYEFRYRTSKAAGWQEKNPLDKPVDIPYDRRSQYQVQVRVVCKDICGIGSSDWSETQSIGEEQPPDWFFHMALIAIPVVVSIGVILFLLFFKKLRVLILPQIPDPMKLFKEMMNSKEDGMAAGSHLTENAAVPQSKSWERQRLYVPEDPELCTNIRVEEPDTAADP